jgi:membrane-bound lytic murein transglycosylase D
LGRSNRSRDYQKLQKDIIGDINLKRRVVVALSLLFISAQCYGILPLPYPTDPIEDELQPWQLQTKDPKAVVGYTDLLSGAKLREMELPTYQNPTDTLGYKAEETFAVPPELEERVDFWKKIYTEFTSNQVVLHDAEYPHIIYDVLDITRFNNDTKLTTRKKMRLMSKFLKGEKEKIVQKLLQLRANKNDPLKIPLDAFAIFKQFEEINETDKFLMATQRIRAQVGQRDRVMQGFLYGGRYFNKMMEIFQSKKIPKELTRLPLVESAFNLAARSKVGASGVWQFMRSTGKLFLRIDRAVDERNDPITCSYAAADLLAGNYQALGSWPLAITAYNHGREGMAKAVRILATTNLAEIIKNYKGRTFGFASSNFYSEFLAILEIEKEYRKYFGKMMVDSPIRYEEFEMKDDVKFDEIASACNISEKDLAILNPALTDWVVTGRGYVPKLFMLKVPPEKKDKCRSGYRNITASIPDDDDGLTGKLPRNNVTFRR